MILLLKIANYLKIKSLQKKTKKNRLKIKDQNLKI